MAVIIEVLRRNVCCVQVPVGRDAVGRDYMHAKYVHVLVKSPRQATDCRRQLADGDAVLPDHSGINIRLRRTTTTRHHYVSRAGGKCTSGAE